jgi:hypothetical protein
MSDEKETTMMPDRLIDELYVDQLAESVGKLVGILRPISSSPVAPSDGVTHERVTLRASAPPHDPSLPAFSFHLNYASDAVVVTQEEIDRRKASAVNTLLFCARCEKRCIGAVVCCGDPMRPYSDQGIADVIASWLEEHGEDEEFGEVSTTERDEEFMWPSMAKLAAAIREGRWRK